MTKVLSVMEGNTKHLEGTSVTVQMEQFCSYIIWFRTDVRENANKHIIKALVLHPRIPLFEESLVLSVPAAATGV